LASGGERYPQPLDPDRPGVTNLLESIRFALSQRIRTHFNSAILKPDRPVFGYQRTR
jgi:hypothetical protein